MTSCFRVFFGVVLVIITLGGCGDETAGGGGSTPGAPLDGGDAGAKGDGGSAGALGTGGSSAGDGSGGSAGIAGTDGGATAGPVDEEFVGPFPSWKNVKDFGATGDGTTDDTSAIQAALTDLKAVMTNSYSVLYFPAGTYRITQTLVTARAQHNDYLGVSIVGEDPATTTLVWDGPADQIMVSLDAWYAKVSRLSFDGKSKASVGLYRGDTFSTACELSDLHFRDMATGVQFGGGLAGGNGGQAEHAVLRCRFERMAKHGILTSNFNSLDIWVWYSRFEDCNAGVHNESGNFHVYRSVFLRSKAGDITAVNLGEFSIVGNTSVESKTFLNWKSFHSWGAQVLVQGNRIYDTLDDFAVVTGSAGPWLLVDNVIRNRPGHNGPSVSAAANDQVLVGNTYTGTDAIHVDNGRGNVRVRNVGAKLVARDAIPAPDLTLPPTPPNKGRRILEVDRNTGDDAAALQARIDAAALEPAGTRPVVHLPKGAYNLARTVVVPANKELQIIGDGFGDNATNLGNTSGATPALRLDGPSRAVLRDFFLNGGSGDALVITNADQPGGRVFADQLNASSDPSNPPAYGIHVNGIEQSDVSLFFAGMSGNVRNIVARGGPLRSNGQLSPGQVSLFNGATSSAGLFFDVEDGGVLLAEALWYEGAWADPKHFDLDSSGSLTVTGLRIALAKDAAVPLVRIHGHKGSFTMLASNLTGLSGPGPALRFEIDGDGTDTKVLALGNTFWVNDTAAAAVGDVWKDTSSPSAEAALTSCHQTGNIPNGFAPLPNVTGKMTDTDPSDAVILEGLEVLRAARIEPPNTRPPGVTDVKIFRVFARTGKDKTTVEIRR